MSTNYPSGIDSFNIPLGTIALGGSSPKHTVVHKNTADAITAIQSTLGVNPHGSYETVAARIEALSSGGGGGGSSYGYNVMDDEFGAAGSGLSTPLTTEEAADFNARFAAYGAQGAYAIVAGDERDYAAIQCCMWKAAHTGRSIYIPAGTYVTNKVLSLIWTETPAAGQLVRPRLGLIHGDGATSRIYAKGIPSGRGCIELLGESNGVAVNCEISNIAVEQDGTCHRYSWCLRLGDGWAGITLNRVFCYGANGIRLKVASSVSYANLCTVLMQCVVWTNWLGRWHASNATADVYALAPESGGAYWDNVKVISCIFQGQVDVRAFVLNFDTCLFFTPSDRPVGFNGNVLCYLGALSFQSCYFEDHYVAISTAAWAAPITSVSMRDCHFTGINNIPSGFSHRAILCSVATYDHGPVTIENCRFGPHYTYSCIDLYGPLTAAVLRCSCPFNAPINTGPTITKTPNVRLVVWSPNGNLAKDTIEYTNVRIRAPELVGPTDITQDVNAGAENVDSNTNAGSSAYAARVVSANGFTGKIAAFGPGHVLANQFWLFTPSNHPVVIGVGGVEQSRFTEAGQQIQGNGYAGEFGTVIKNPASGVSAISGIRVVQNQDKGLALLSFCQGHPLAGQSWAFTQTAEPFVLGSNNTEVIRLSPDRSLTLRNVLSVGGGIFSQTVSAAVGNVTTENSVVGAGVGTVTVPAGELVAGRAVYFKMRGFISSTGLPTLNVRCKLGSVTVASTGAVAQVGTPASVAWELDVELVVRSVGVSGTAISQGFFTYGGVTVPLSAASTVAINTTIANNVDVTVQWGTANAGNVITSTQFTPGIA